MRVFWLLLLSAGMVCAGWLKREGRYATVEFNPGYETLADSLLNISDRVLPRLCALQGVDIRAFNARKTRIILTDAPDVTNGYAVENNVVIFVRSSSYLRGWSGPFTWYNLVLEHELAHHVTFRAIRRTSDWFGQFNLVSAPRWFFEGIAQYLAESWTPFRGDIFLKEEVINNRFTYDDLNNLDNGRLLYAAGHAYIRWLAATYGDSSLIRLMRHKPDAFYYDFEEAFEAVYGKDSEDLFPYFARYLTLHYGDRLADQTPFKPVNNLPAFGDRDLNIQPLPGRDSVYVVRTLLKKNHLFATALIGSVKNGEARVDKILSQDIQTPVYVSSDGQWLAWGRPHATVEEDQTATAFDWYMYNRGQNMKRHVATAIRAVEAAVDTSGVLYLATADGLASRLLRFAGPFHADTLFETANSLGAIRLADQKTLLFEAQSNRTAQRDLFQWRDGIIWQITNDSTEQRNPFIWNGDTLLYNTMIERHAALIMRAGRNDTLIDTREDIWLTGVDRARRAVMLAYRQADGRRYFTGYPLDSLLHHPLKTQHPVPAIHTDWIDKKAMTAVVPDTLPPVVRHTSHAVFPQGVLMPLQNLAFPVYDAQSGLSVFASSVWAEALQRHIIAVNGIWNAQPENRLASMFYMLRALNLEWSAAWYYGPVIFPIDASLDEHARHNTAYAGVARQRYWRGNPRLPYRLSADFVYESFKDGTRSVAYPAVRISARSGYRMPSRYDGVIPRRQLFLDAQWLQSLDDGYDFHVWQGALQAGSYLFSEKAGIKARLNYSKIAGHAPTTALTGLDRFYTYAMPRDFGYTHSVRGLYMDVPAREMAWASLEWRYLLATSTGMKLLFIPMDNMAVTVFADGARLNNKENYYSWGVETGFGANGLRLNAGYARAWQPATAPIASLYLRLSLELDNIVTLREKWPR